MHLQLWRGCFSSRSRKRGGLPVTVGGRERLLTSLRTRRGCNLQVKLSGGKLLAANSGAPRTAKTTPTPVIFRLHFPAILAPKPSLLLHPLHRTRIKLSRCNRDRTNRIAIEWHFALPARSSATARTSMASGQSRYRQSSSIAPEFQGFGWFVGVDIFFVISGFLITGIVWSELGEGSFSLQDFSVRRIRRIFPALFAVLFFCSIAAFFLLTPHDLEAFGKSLNATVSFYSNIHWDKNTNYFDGPAIEKPLLHTWSLSVEEQFYAVWPLALLS